MRDEDLERGVASIVDARPVGALVRKLVETIKLNVANLNVAEIKPLLLSLGDAYNHVLWESAPVLNAAAPSECYIPCFEVASLRVLELGQASQSQSQRSSFSSRLRCHIVVNPKCEVPGHYRAAPAWPLQVHTRPTRSRCCPQLILFCIV